MKEALLYEKRDKNKVKCIVCQVRCLIPEGERGFCNTRLNKGGTLYTLIYGVTSSLCLDPIEKKPFFHFYPGTTVLSMGTRGCNFKCPGCQNWEISHDQPDEIGGNMMACTPRQSVELALSHHAQGIAWTYNDPSIWLEHTLEAAQIAKASGLYTCYITNGYATQEHLDLIGPYLDAYKLDLKGFSKESYKKISGGLARFEELLENTVYVKEKWKAHVEIVTNITPTVNDSDDLFRAMARWIAQDLGPLTPWHVTRFYPHLELAHVEPTPLKTLERARDIGLEAGLKYVYVGNVPGHPAENTYCHHCGHLAIERQGFSILHTGLDEKGNCSACGTPIPGVHLDRLRPHLTRRTPLILT